MNQINQLLEFGIINIDKPQGPTSFQVSEYIMKSLNLRKTSHMGTLDPAVSGVLPITLNRACKLSKYLMKKDKTYVGIMRLHTDINENKLKEEMRNFIGKIKQMPPVRSSVKRAEREREVYDFRIVEREGKDVLFEAHVEAGTYIRTLIHNLGGKIGGAHMLELRRTSAGIFHENGAVNLYEFDKAVDEYKKDNNKMLQNMIMPAEEIIKKVMHLIEIKEDRLKEILNGKPIRSKDLKERIDLEKGSYAGIFSDEKFIEVARIVNEGDVIAVPEFVLN